MATKEQFKEYVNQKEMAEILGITPRRVRDLKKEGIISEENDGYPVLKNCQSYIDYKTAYEEAHLMNADRKEAADELDRLKAEHEQIKTEISRIRLGRMNGTLISSKNFEEFLTVKIRNMVRQLDELPEKVIFATAGMSQDEAIRTADKLVQDIIDDFGQWPDGNDYNFQEPFFEYLDEDEDDEDDEDD